MLATFPAAIHLVARGRSSNTPVGPCRRLSSALTTYVVTMKAAPGQSVDAPHNLNLETEKCRLEDFALKRKFASLSSKLDRVHRQVMLFTSSAMTDVVASSRCRSRLLYKCRSKCDSTRKSLYGFPAHAYQRMIHST